MKKTTEKNMWHGVSLNLVSFFVGICASLHTHAQTIGISDLRTIDAESFHHVYDSASAIAVEYLNLPTVSTSDLAKKILIVQQHQYDLSAFYRDFVKSLAVKYQAKEAEVNELFEQKPLHEYYENALLQDMHWSDITLLGHMHMYCVSNNEMIPAMLSHALEKGNQKITALNLLNWVRNEYGLQSPCELYRSYKLYTGFPYANDSTWLSIDEDNTLHKFYTVYKNHCENAVYPFMPKGNWIRNGFNDEILFYREEITPVVHHQKALADLSLDTLREPEYNKEINGTMLTLIISNTGKGKSEPCIIKITNGTGSLQGYDAIWYEKLDAINAGENRKIVIGIPNHWVYNPDASLEITIDKFNAVPETNKKNNVIRFFRQG